MSGNIQKKTSNFLVTFLIGLIVVSFMFTGMETMKGTPDSVAQVGPLPIKAREYQQEFTRQQNFYKQIFGGKDLTSQQIEQFRLRENTIRNLVQRKLMLLLGDEVGVYPAPNAVKDEIKTLEFFQNSAKQFDINRYKQLLAANRLSPQEFENDMITQVKGQKTQDLLASFPVSNGYAETILGYKTKTFRSAIAVVKKEGLRKHLTVGPTEIKKYMGEDANKARVESLFKERKPMLDVPEKVKASHILLMTKGKDEAKVKAEIEKIAKEVTPKNFKRLANKYTEDPSGKGKGGSLGYFQRGKMVPEFDRVAFSQKRGTISKPLKTQFGYHLIFVENKTRAQPATLEKFQDAVAIELIRKEKNDELEALYKKVSGDVHERLKRNDIKGIEKLKSKYGFTFDKKSQINAYEGSVGMVATIPAAELEKIFKMDLNVVDTLSIEGITETTLIRLMPYTPTKEEKAKAPTVAGEVKNFNLVFGNKLRASVIKGIEDKHKVRVFNERFR